jgi:hypothetical protein
MRSTAPGLNISLEVISLSYRDVSNQFARILKAAQNPTSEGYEKCFCAQKYILPLPSYQQIKITTSSFKITQFSNYNFYHSAVTNRISQNCSRMLTAYPEEYACDLGGQRPFIFAGKNTSCLSL